MKGRGVSYIKVGVDGVKLARIGGRGAAALTLRSICTLISSFCYSTMPPKKKKRLYPFQENYAEDFGVRVTCRNEDTGVVEACVCRFCECWGREVEDEDDEGVGPARKRKKTTNSQHFKTSFRCDNMRKHMKEQHPKKWKEYEELKKSLGRTPELLQKFFEQSTIDAFFEKRSTLVGRKRVFTIEKDIVEVVVKECLMPSSEDADEDADEDDADVENLRGDIGMEAFKPEYEVTEDGSKVVACYKVTVPNPLQFDYVVSLLAAGLSFRQISRVVLENRDRLGCASKTGCLSDGEASCYSRIVCAVGLQILSDLMKKSWAFAVASDVCTDDFGNSHLDVRVRFPGLDTGDDLLSFHLLAIPLFDESHSGASLFEFFAKVFDALCPNWKDKLIGSSTDGAPNMTGCNVGFTTQLANAVNGDAFYRIWCLAHQLDLIIKAALHAMADSGHFPFMNILTTIIGWLRRQDSLIRQLQSKCPYYISVRWTSVSKVCFRCFGLLYMY